MCTSSFYDRHSHKANRWHGEAKRTGPQNFLEHHAKKARETARSVRLTTLTRIFNGGGGGASKHAASSLSNCSTSSRSSSGVLSSFKASPLTYVEARKNKGEFDPQHHDDGNEHLRNSVPIGLLVYSFTTDMWWLLPKISRRKAAWAQQSETSDIPLLLALL